MKIFRKRILSVVLMFFVSFLLLITIGNGKVGAVNTIEVDVGQVLSDVSNHPMGLGLFYLSDQDEPKLKQQLDYMNVGSLRFASSEYYFFDKNAPDKPKVTIQDRDNFWQIQIFVNPEWEWYSKMSFDQFMDVCQSVEAEPFVIIPIDAIAYTGSGVHFTEDQVVQAAVDWVRYANITKGYNIKHWEIGNENDLPRTAINWTPEEYGRVVVKISQAIKAVDPSIQVGANGMKLKDPSDWWSRLMPTIKNDVDFLVTHQYSWEQNYETWRDSPWSYDYNIKYAIDAINTYNPQLRLNVTENSSFNPSFDNPNNVWKMLHNFEVLGQTLRFDKVDYVHFWTSRWLEQEPLKNDYSAFDANYNILPMGYPIHIWGTFLKKKMVYASDVDKIRSWASYDPDDQSLSLFLLNKDTKRTDVTVNLKNYGGTTLNKRWVLRGFSPSATKVSWGRAGSVRLRNSQITTKLTPLSVTVIRFQKAG